MLFQPSAHLNLTYQVIHYVEAHLDQPFTIRTISDELGVSYFYLHHLFGETTGQPLGELIKRLRLEQAFGYLKHSAYSVGDIGELTGFGSKHSFSRAFSQHFNYAPSTVRTQSNLVVTDSFVHQDGALATYRGHWKQRMLDGQYAMRPLPPMNYFFQYLGTMATDRSASFNRRLQRVFELQTVMQQPIVLSTSAIGCATHSQNAMIRAGFLVKDDRTATYLSQSGFFQRRFEAGNYLMARFNGELPAGSLLTYSLIQESVQQGLFRLRDHNSLILVEPTNLQQFEVWVPVN
ncbi:Regulatory protein soxS [Fibrisoma limi BUZ 3]|uniref:Regulatory protein soxS n=1 Tax=Fibrisoma limi BUZ 3 TaxID=1185876 RepID=I2GGG1_9BACT|nr:AraC family transcriptional regulator [Fibrisoma limi]CCH52986.1 Regulatory protein soxS [Fibrisoma limi BUZ 3]